MELREIIAGVEGNRSTLALCNVDAPTAVLDAVGGYLEPRNLAIRRTTTEHGLPKNVAILHDGEQFRAASDLREVYEFADPAIGANTADDLGEVSVPAVVRALDRTTFTDYGKRRMIVASREIEKRAWQVGAGAVHAGFQRLSVVGSQRRVYRTLAETGLDVHVYGVPDADPSLPDATVHGFETDELADSWFVAFDGDGDDDEKCALLARETPEANAYRGFWTYRTAVVDRILDRLESAYAV